MKKIFVLLVWLPVLSFAQVKPTKTKTAKQEPTKLKTLVPDVKIAEEGYEITGSLTGYADGTLVELQNGNNRMPEGTTTVKNGTFKLSGKLDYPDFKLLILDKSNEFIPLFLDNSKITIELTKGALDRVIVKGSPAHNDFMAYSQVTKPYEPLFQKEVTSEDKSAVEVCATILINFINQKPASYISPLAIYRLHQITNDDAITEKMYELLNKDVKASPIGAYVGQTIEEAKKNPLGKVISDFEQADPSGRMINIKSYRGKYVLIDFWASWCGPCRGENPNVVAAYNRYKDKGFTVLGISLDKSKDPWLEAIAKDGLAWNQVSDLKGWTNAVAQQFGITSIPQNFLVDPNGIVIARNLRGPALEEKLQSLFEPQSNIIPDFQQEDANGKMVSIQSFRGKYVLIDFWASWCGPCRAENPNVVNAYNRFKDKNFTILGVSLDSDKAKWQNAVKADKLTWTHVSDLKGWSNAVAQKFKINSIPANILIDPQGNIIGKNLRGEELQQKLEALLK